MEILFGSIVFLLLALFWLIPLLMIIKSKRTSGSTKALWVIAVLFISWLAWIVYFLMVPKANKLNRFANPYQ